MTVSTWRGPLVAGGLSLTLSLTVLTAVPTSSAAPPGDRAAATAATAAPRVAVRVDQVGYLTGERKVAYVMGSAGRLSGLRFQVLDRRGRVVLAGRPGGTTGAWNARYAAVRTLDLTRLRRPGLYRLRVTGAARAASPRFRVGSRAQVTGPLAADTVRFLQLQRDGADQVAPGRRPSHLLDETATVYAAPSYDRDGRLTAPLVAAGGPVDVAGGWFDAGDFLKFTGTTAYTTIALLTASRTAADSPALRAEAAHGLAWLDRMYDEGAGTLFTQVGIGNGNDEVLTDHDVWRLPEADDATATPPGTRRHLISHRPVFRANEPGRPVPPSLAGRVAAAFALAAQDSDDPVRARAWLAKAADLYARADTSPRRNATAYPAAFYPEDSWQDDLELAAVQLAIAGTELGDPRAGRWHTEAASWARAYAASEAHGTLEVADVSALAHAALADLDGPGAALAVRDLRRQLRVAARTAGRDAFGVGSSYTDYDSAPHALGLAATAALYEEVTGDARFRAFGTAQRNWVLGANAWGSSFVIGAGRVHPQCPEHQVANLTGRPATGAVVNGPNRASLLEELNGFPTMKRCSAHPGTPYRAFDGHGARYLDHVGAWQTVEPAIDFTANGLLAFSLGS